MDPAVIDFASKTNVTRYVKVELMMLKNTRSAQAPPLCRFDQRIARLDIFKNGSEPPRREDLDNQKNKPFHQQAPPNLTINNWDAKVYDHIQNCHRSLMFPQLHHYNKGKWLVMLTKDGTSRIILFTGNFENPRLSYYAMNQNAERGVSWEDQNQYANFQYGQLPSYPRKYVV